MMRLRKNLLCILLILCLLLSETSVFAAEPQGAEGSPLELIFVDAKTGRKDGPITAKVYKGPLAEGKMQKASGDERIILQDVQEGELFTYRIEAKGFYTYVKVKEITASDLRRGYKEISYTLDKRMGKGYEPVTVSGWTEEVEDKLFRLYDLWNVDKTILNTPAFGWGKGAHQFTSVEEGVDYLKRICRNSSQAYLYYLNGQTDCPVVVFTREDLSSVNNLKDAAAEIAKRNTMKVMYQAQIHGNEPAAGEGALTVCGRLARDGEILSDMDVVVIPYVSGSGAKAFTRNDGSGIDLNRDALLAKSKKTKDLHKLYQQLMPHLFIDGHEFLPEKAVTKDAAGNYYLEGLDDIQITCLDNLNCGEGVFELEKEIVKGAVDGLRNKGFRSFFFPADWDSSTSCNYARLQNSLTFLVESAGIKRGKQHFERRVLSQYESVMLILKQASGRTSKIRKTVDTARDSLVKQGRTYSLDNRFVLSHKITTDDPMTGSRMSCYFDGSIRETAHPVTFYNRAKAQKSRSRPTAYLISKKAAGAQKAKEILTAAGAKYFQLPAKSKVKVSQYTGTGKAAKISKQKTLTFSKGAYVFYMDQPAANIISALLEPDSKDSADSKGSLVQAGVLRKKGSGYPIYRYTGKNPQKNLKRK